MSSKVDYVSSSKMYIQQLYTSLGDAAICPKNNVAIELEGTTDEILTQLSEITNQSIIYNPEIFDDEYYNIVYSENNLSSAIQELFDSRDYEVIYNEHSIIIKKLPVVFIAGLIKQKSSLITLPYAAIKVMHKEIFTTSDENGNFHLSTTLPADLIISYLGHRDTIIRVNDQSDPDVIVELEADNELQEIVITGAEHSNNLINRYDYSGDKIQKLTKEIPGIGGNDDLLHATRGVAGISSGNGGIGGYFIRGGNNSQNLFLLDGVSVYNPFHSFGLTSIVTADVSQNLQIYKSGFRARHADKSSGIIDVKIKEGNAQTFHTHGDINTQDGSISMQGPILKEHTSFFISGRSTTLSGPFNNIVRDAIYRTNQAENSTSYYDIVLKLRSQINPRNTLEFTAYKSDDIISGELEPSSDIDENEQRLHWGNELYTLKWSSTLSSQFITNLRISSNSYFTDYQILNEFDDEEQNVLYIDNSSINQDFNIDLRLDALINERLRLQTGLTLLTKQYAPNSNILTEDSDEIDTDEQLSIASLSNITGEVEELESMQWSWYGELLLENSRHRLIAGYRLNQYLHDEYSLLSLLPRLSYNYFLNDKHRLELSISQTAQYDQLLSLSDLYLPQDIWLPSNERLVPQRGWHYNASYNMSNNRFIIRNELFLKLIDGITYSTYNPIDGAFTGLNLYTVQGKSKVFGYELSGEYISPACHLFSSLSISKSSHQFNEINLGNEYPSQFDRRLEFKLMGSFNISERLKIGFVNSMASGHPLLVTEPVNEELGLAPLDINLGGSKNQQRDRFMHRLDLSLIYSFQTKRIQHRIKVNLYNSYNISQPLYYVNDGSGLEPSFSLPTIFSIAYSFNF